MINDWVAMASDGSDEDATIVDPVGATSRLTAAARATETERGDQLFSDPFAAELAGPEGFQALNRHNAERSEGSAIVANPAFVIRTRFFDDFLVAETAEQRINQVVLIAAGLDTRAFRLRWPVDVQLYELDQPEVVAYKDAILRSRGAEPTCQRTVVEVDLRDQWAPTLVAAGFRPNERSVWLAEGLTFYLDEAAVRRLFSDIATLASPGDGLGTDFVSRAPPGVGASIRFTTDDATSLLEDCGWEAVEHSYYFEGERLGRHLPYRNEPNGFMAIAHRTR